MTSQLSRTLAPRLAPALAPALALVALAASAHADAPTMKTAGAARCTAGAVNVLAKLPADESFSLSLELAMNAKRGIALYRDAQRTWQVLRLDANGAARGKPIALTNWPQDAETRVYASGKGFIAIGQNGCEKSYYCVVARWISADGALGPIAQADVGHRHMYFEAWRSGAATLVMQFDRSSTDKTDAFVTFDHGEGDALALAVHEVDLGGHDAHIYAEHEADGTLWLLLAKPEGTDHLRIKASYQLLDQTGAVTKLSGWDQAWQLVATAPGHRVLVFTDSDRHTELADLAIEDGKLVEKHRSKYDPVKNDPRAFPAPFELKVPASEGTNEGIALERSVWGHDPPKTLLSRHLAPEPGPVVWDSGAFYATYAERNKSNVVLALRRVTCK